MQVERVRRRGTRVRVGREPAQRFTGGIPFGFTEGAYGYDVIIIIFRQDSTLSQQGDRISSSVPCAPQVLRCVPVHVTGPDENIDIAGHFIAIEEQIVRRELLGQSIFY